MKIFVTRYNSPETRTEVECEEGECAACSAVDEIEGVYFVELEFPDKKMLRRVEVVTLQPGIHFADAKFGFFGIILKPSLSAFCEEVTPEQADAEIKAFANQVQ